MELMLKVFNAVEVLLWLVVGCSFLYLSRGWKTRQLPTRILGLNFLLFAGTDVVEYSSGAWWKPWWLLVWNGVCVTIFVGCAVEFLLWRYQSLPNESESGTGSETTDVPPSAD